MNRKLSFITAIFFLGLFGFSVHWLHSDDCIRPGDSGCRRPPSDNNDNADDSDESEDDDNDHSDKTESPPDPCGYCAQQCDKQCIRGIRPGVPPTPYCQVPACCEEEDACLIVCRKDCEAGESEDVQNEQPEQEPAQGQTGDRQDRSHPSDHCDLGSRDESGGVLNFDIRLRAALSQSIEPPWPHYRDDREDDGDGVPPRVMWVNNGRTLLLWHFTDSGRGLASSVRGDRLCRATIRYKNEKGEKIVKQLSSNRKKLTMGGSWRQERFKILGGSRHAIRHLYEFAIGLPETEVEYVVGCEPDNLGRTGDWTLAGKGTGLSPNYLAAQDHDISFVAIGDMWAKVSSDLLGPGGGRLEDTTTKWVHDSMWQNYFKPSPLSGKPSDFVLVAGDYSNADGCALEYYKSLLPIYADIAADYPIYSVAGNHDYHCDEGYSYFKMNMNPGHAGYRHNLGEPAGDNYSRSFYRFNYGKMHIIGLNIPMQFYKPNDEHFLGQGTLHAGMFKKGDPQYEWLKETLSSIPEDDVKILFFHARPHCDEPSRSDFCRLVDEANVDLIIVGHEEMANPDVQMINIIPGGLRPDGVPVFRLPSGGVCRLSIQNGEDDAPVGGPYCDHPPTYTNKFGYLAVHYQPSQSKIILESISVNSERWGNARPAFSHRWIYDLTTKATTQEF